LLRLIAYLSLFNCYTRSIAKKCQKVKSTRRKMGK
jgi:hypothetical protein